MLGRDVRILKISVYPCTLNDFSSECRPNLFLVANLMKTFICHIGRKHRQIEYKK